MYDELTKLVEKWRKLSELLYSRSDVYAGDYASGRADSMDTCANHVERILELYTKRRNETNGKN